MTYLDEIKKSMKLLSDNGYWLIGQNATAGGTSMFHTYKDYFENRKIELPVAEEMQAGIGTGLSLSGHKVLSIYPRFDFMILALNQIINHLDKFEEMSSGQLKPTQIFRVCVGSVSPMMPGPQHMQDYFKELKSMCRNIKVVKLDKPEKVYKEYKKAMKSDKPVVLVEYSDLYNRDFAFKDIRESKNIK